MGVEYVYRCLQQVFPQIDNRILKAVAFEHPKDADAAVNDVLTEVLPHLPGPSNSFEVAQEKKDTLLLPYPTILKAKQSPESRSTVGIILVDNSRLPSDPNCTAVGDSVNINSTNSASQADPIPLLDNKVVDAEPSSELASVLIGSKEPVNESKASSFLSETETETESETESQLAAKNMDEDIIEDLALLAVSPSSENENDVFSERLTETDYMANGCVVVSDGKMCEVDERIHFPTFERISSGDLTEETIYSNLASKSDYCVVETDSNDDAFASNGAFTQSGQICNTDFLDEIIEDAKNNKKTLFSVMDSVMNMMRQVEIEEKAADLAKEEANMGGLDILVKVEDLKEMLAHARETNSMHAGEVYGEKAILATEARELQSRLLCLSDERDKSLATLDEMRQSLEARLAAAQEMKKSAELDKLRKEESAQKALAEQEAIMEKVVQESKLLEQEAAENSKLQEFLVDRGRIVDALQGEISVICQDVSLLKEKFDNRVPLSLSVSSSQTACKLASSGSSLKSLASDLVPEEPESSKTPEEVSSVSSTGCVTPKHSAEEDFVNSNEKEIEDGWDIFDKDEEMLM